MEALVCLQDQGIYNNNDYGIIIGRSQGLSKNYRCVSRGQGIRDASEVLETMTEAAGDIRRTQGIYDNNIGVRGGR